MRVTAPHVLTHNLMNWETLLSGAIAAGLITGAVELIRLFAARHKVHAETTLNIAQAASEVVEGGEKAVEAMKKVLMVYEVRDEQKTKRIDEQDKEIAALRAQVVAIHIDATNKQNELTAVIEALKAYIAVLIETLRRHNITDIPPRPDILKDTDPKIKAVK